MILKLGRSKLLCPFGNTLKRYGNRFLGYSARNLSPGTESVFGCRIVPVKYLDSCSSINWKRYNSSEGSIDKVVFESVCAETLESLCDYFEELIETVPKLKNADVTYSDGVLTVHLGKTHGTYVINRQSPNFQIWLSSPKSGPKRYDFVNGTWIYKHDQTSLHSLLDKEIETIAEEEVEFTKSIFTRRARHLYTHTKMEIMEEGNLLDRVRILLQRDLDYYGQHQTVLQETLCTGIVGGLLDFPHYASFAAVKLVIWWEEQFKGTFHRSSGLIGTAHEDAVDEVDRGCGGIVANAAPAEFVKMANDTSGQLLEHLHVLSQEALDHADLTVLTATLGAAALVKNTLWCYNEQVDAKGSTSLRSCYKQYQEMSEALAERLLDLHCRLLSLYVMQDVDSLSWDHPHPFFEGERGSFVVQMWWLYMQGTRRDLWTSVPPKTAQRVLSGMLNESLTILASRYSQAEPSAARSLLLVTDIGNILMCVYELLPSICSDASELLGLNGGAKILRDIHSKCHQLLVCFVLRGCPLSTLFKVFRNGMENVTAFEERFESFAPWILLVSPELRSSSADSISDLSEGYAIMLEIKVLVAQPQPSYPLLLNILTMRDFKVATLLLNKMIPLLANEEPRCFGGEISERNVKCKGFLCSGGISGGDCKSGDGSAYDAVYALTAILVNVCSADDLSRLVLPAIEKIGPSWANCLDRHQVWNLNRPSWLSAILAYLEAPLVPLVHTVIRAASAGESTEQAIAITLAGILKLADVFPPQIYKIAFVLQQDIPADVKPLGKSVLVQMLISVVYELLTKSKEDSAIALAEALCHLRVPYGVIEQLEDYAEEYVDDGELAFVSDITVSRILFTQVGRHALKSVYRCVIDNREWLLSTLIPGFVPSSGSDNLLQIMFHIGNKPFDQILSGEWKPDYLGILERPLSLSRETAWMNLSKRPDFTGNSSSVSKHDKAVIENISALFLNVD